MLTPVLTSVSSVYTYELLVFTGACEGAATQANVHATIMGERGDTGKRKLLKSKESGDKFIQGKVDVFEVEAVDLVRPTEVILGHDGLGHGAGWFVDKVVIKDVTNSQEYYFPCERYVQQILGHNG